jgi:hypothetical protein
MTGRLLLGVMLLALAASPAIAGRTGPTWTLDASGSSYTYHCGGDDWIEINGKHNALTVTGECAEVEIVGSGNEVSIESVGSIRVSGNNNDVRYERGREGKKKPAIKNRGAANTIRRDR